MVVLTGTGRGFVKNWSKECSIKIFSCTVLFCSVLFCSVLYCTVLFCSVLLCKIKWTFFYEKGNFFCIHGNDQQLHMWAIIKSGIYKFKRKFGQNEMINQIFCLL